MARVEIKVDYSDGEFRFILYDTSFLQEPFVFGLNHDEMLELQNKLSEAWADVND